MRRLHGLWVSIACLAIVACSKPPESAAPPPPTAPAQSPLVGQWHIAVGNRDIDCELTAAGEDQLRLSSRTNSAFAGLYKIQGDKLVMLTPNMPSMAGLEWHIDSNDVLAVVTPATKGNGQTYLGVIMKRGAAPTPTGDAVRTPPPPARAGASRLTPPRLATEPPMPTAESPLIGNWQTANSPRIISYQIIPADNGAFWLTSNLATTFRGIYKVVGDKFIMVSPAQANMTGLEWHIDSNDKLTVVTPANPGSGTTYLGFAMTRVPAGTPFPVTQPQTPPAQNPAPEVGIP